MNMYFNFSIYTSASDLARAAERFDLVYLADADEIVEADSDYLETYAGEIVDAAQYLRETARFFLNKEWYFKLSFDTFDKLREYIGAEYCDDIGNYATDYTYIERSGYYVHDTWDYCYCEECGEWVHCDEWDSRRDMCQRCASERGNGRIDEYHANKGYYTMYGDSPRRIGVEVEFDGGKGSDWYEVERAAEDAAAIMGGHVYFEEDSSLTCGAEMITQPHDWQSFWALDWRGAFDALIENGMRAHDAGTCGLHIHFAREWFGETEGERVENIGMMLNFYRKNYDTLFTLSRRKSAYWCERDYDSRGSFDSFVAYKKRYGSHGTAVNLGNYDGIGTIEFRLGRGTLNFETFRAWIDLHRAIVEQSARACNYDFATWINPQTVSAETWAWIEEKHPQLAADICGQELTAADREAAELAEISEEIEKQAAELAALDAEAETFADMIADLHAETAHIDLRADACALAL